ERGPLLDGLVVLGDLLGRELRHELQTGLDLLDRLRLEAAGSHRAVPDVVALFRADEYRGPAVRRAPRARRDVSEVRDVVEAYMAARLLVLVGDLQRELDHRTAIGVDPELALADVHLHDVLDLRVGVVLDELEDRLVWEVLHAEDADRERDLVGDVAQADRVELALPDRLHLARSPDDPELVEAVRPGRLLDERDVR